MKIKNKVEKKIRQISLSKFMIILIGMLAVILFGVTTSIFTSVYKNSLYQTATLNSEQTVSQVSDTIELYSKQIQENLQLVQKEIERCQNRNEVNRYLNSMVQIQSNLVSIVVYDESGNILDCGTSSQMLKGVRKDDQSFRPEQFDKGDYEISAPHIQNIFEDYYPWVATVGTPMHLDIYGTKVYLAMDVRFFSILSYVDSVSIGQHGYCFVVDSENNIVYHPQQQLLYSGIKEEDMDTVASLEEGAVVKGDIIYAMEILEGENWRVIGVSYTDEVIHQKINIMYQSFLAAFLVCFLIAVIFIRMFTKRVSRPVQELVKAMQEFEKNAQDYEYQKVTGVYDVQILSESFAHMVLRIQNLMEHVKKEEITLRRTELKALQTQINPHFLYNTLDSIQWMCEQGNQERAVEMVSALAKLFRISISKGREFISIEDELQHARNYLVIQSFRYKNQFTYRFEVEEQVKEYLCNKITLQPIIENAVIHGIDGLCDEGEIVIQAKEEEEDILFVVSDNGIGMTKEQCEKIIKHDVSDNFGIGIKNVNDRIRIYFGENYGLQIESELDEGTRVYIRIPKLTQQDVENMNLN